MAFRNRGESDIVAVLNNGATSAMNVDINILAIMHSDLSGSNNDNAILNCGDMSCASHVTCDD